MKTPQVFFGKAEDAKFFFRVTKISVAFTKFFLVNAEGKLRVAKGESEKSHFLEPEVHKKAGHPCRLPLRYYKDNTFDGEMQTEFNTF